MKTDHWVRVILAGIVVALLAPSDVSHVLTSGGAGIEVRQAVPRWS